ncbi:type IV pilus secretin PilQ [Dasania sp. GY-MA-18]|uniref:Type IV pilus secretin PilQ family protein n=1 Tax=Dasania phycosphaerae TaxID=2950436 RepID=A0A9J6RKB1_9GAMM|nr:MULTISPECIES: type IV pilus secretin PilQ family protein [Dasania]MCR8922416.1 type IV pilus secretin PilQ [Dasania sp. GY-MA-18]MCZ0864844.1 type IV pilus secretin PilQ family protein [Dasania phycosphaerae]MCZ0868572.1 type IV pilus secretin PilQ family protein [Dasania phycosphaerae]
MDIANRSQQLQRGISGCSANLQRPLRIVLALSCLLISSLSLASVNLTGIDFSSKQGGRFQVKLDFDGTPPEPKGYNIEKPARIALDFAGVSSQLKQKKHPLSFGNASSAVVLESSGRTRMILNLVELAPYTTRVEGNSLYVEVGDAGARDYLKPAREDKLVAATQKVSKARGNEIRSIDFKRGELGEGKLLITLDNPKADINVFVEGEKIKIDFKGASIPESLQRRYDVSDFATPVQQVEAAANEGGAIFALRAIGEYDYLAYQTDNDYVVSVKPLTKAESEQRQKEFAYVGEKLSLNFQDIEVRAVLQLIADFTGLNLVASDTVSGKITLRLQNVPWDQALELVLKTKGLDKRQVGNVLMVAPAAEIAERERQEIENNKQVEELAPLQTEYIRIRYADAKALFELFKDGGTEDEGDSGGSGTMLSLRGSIIVDERTNSLLVTETAQKLEDFRRVIKLLDVPIRQVLIEARIVIANSDFDEQLGIQWGGVYESEANSASGGNRLIAGGSNNTFVEQANGETIDWDDALGVDLGVSNPVGSFSLGYIGTDVALSFELSALESQGRGEIVSQPKVITGDKQLAVIKSGTEVPYQQSSGNGATTIAFKEAVLKLEVTPSITPDDRIIMDLVINQDSLGDLIQLPGGRGTIPTIDTTQLETQVLVGNGETVVLGGVFRTEDVKSESKVPVLGDIPYLGRLFRQTSIRQVKAETLIFITPRILADTLID